MVDPKESEGIRRFRDELESFLFRRENRWHYSFPREYETAPMIQILWVRLVQVAFQCFSINGIVFNNHDADDTMLVDPLAVPVNETNEIGIL